MSAQGKKVLAIIGVVFVIGALTVALILIKKYTPSKTVMGLDKYYQLEDNHAAVILQNELSEIPGRYLDGIYYLPYETVKEYLNARFYWDANQSILIYTTPTEVIKAGLGENAYIVNQGKTETTYQVVKAEGSQILVALDFVKAYSNITSKEYDNPRRVVIQYNWDTEELQAVVKKDTQIRYNPGIKFDVLEQIEEDKTVKILDDGTRYGNEQDFYKAIAEDGVIGYIRIKHVEEPKKVMPKNDYQEPVYSHILKDYTINMVWHQVTNEYSNEELLNLLSMTKGVNTIAPTWFSVSGNKGNITSLASETYVERAHAQGVEVWALCDDFDENVSMLTVLSNTGSREKLEKELLSAAIKYELDGINIDFENIPAEAGEHFIQFIREMSIRCRNNGIVLSIDNYPPTEYTAYYNRREQAAVADYVITMAYDEHYAGSEESGSVSSISYVRDAVSNMAELVPPEQTIIALPFYTRLWKEKTKDGKMAEAPESYSMSNAENYLKDHGAKTKWDETTAQYYAEFKEGKITYKMWLEEEKSLEEKMKVCAAGNVAGYSFWKLGLEKKAVWNTIVKYTN